MPNLFSGVNTALQALLSQQQVIEVIDHNVANASTPGYRRQRAVLSAGPAYNPISSPGMMGSGVTVTEIQRYNVEFYNRQYRQEAAETSRWDMQRDVIRRVEATLAETGSDSLTAKMDAFWSGWVTLSSDPTNESYRSDLYDRADALSDAFNSRVLNLEHLRGDLNASVIERVEEINQSAAQIADLNKEIAQILGSGNQPNDLMDQRDMLLDRLSQLAGVDSSVQPNGEVMVSLAGHVLVAGHESFKLSTSNDPVTQITWADGQTFSPATGELKGLLEVRDQVIPAQIAGLNQLAGSIISEVNTVHGDGYNMYGATDIAFFTGTTAGSMKVNPALSDPKMIATAAAAGDPGDGSVAKTIAALRTAPFAGLANSTAGSFYNTQVIRLGLEVQTATNLAKEHDVQLDALDGQRESIAGVNLDEEAANLVKAQRAYQAASRVITVLDEMLDQIINKMGLVGR